MVFSTSSFLFVFLPLFLICYTLTPWRNGVALFFSLLFFSWGEGAYLLLLLLVISFNYFVGAHLDTARTRRLLLAAGVGMNLTVLGYYKYFGFMIGDVLGLDIAPAEVPHLPLGLSFFIFQSISYLVDVYRKESSKADSWFDLALYIAMFPQLIAGPIVRYNTVSEALRNREITGYDVWRGAMLFILGLSYKMLIANNAAEVADRVFALEGSELSSAAAWIGVSAYTLQIYFDFAGYSLMAIGLGRIMGFHFPQNFNYPYISQSITEFWRRWHMSLSSWFRDYLYIPLGGNRHGAARTYLHLCIVFILCGLWHGAAWTFLAWGIYHGVVLAIERAGLGRILNALPRIMRHVYTVLLVMVGWVLFRADSLSQASDFLIRMFVFSDSPGSNVQALVGNENLLYMTVGVVLSLPIVEKVRVLRHEDAATEQRQAGPLLIATNAGVAITLLLLCSVYIMSGTYNPFIYFRF